MVTKLSKNLKLLMFTSRSIIVDIKSSVGGDIEE